MKKLMVRIAATGLIVATTSAVVIATVSASGHRQVPASSPTTTTPITPPIQGFGPRHLYFYVDTVVASGSPGTTGPGAVEAGCSMQGTFVQGQTVVFRMYGVDVDTGGQPLTSLNVASAYVYIPGVGNIPLSYGHDPYWTAAWKTTGYSYGVVNFVVHVTTDPVPATATTPYIPSRSAAYSQAGLPAQSQLTIT